MFKRVTPYLITVLMLSISLAPLAMAKTTPMVSSWWTVEPGNLLDVLKREFEAANPEYEIEYRTVGANQYYDQLQTMIAAGESPDVAMLGFDWIAAMAENKMLTDIDTLVRERFPVNEYFAPLQRALQWKGKYVALSRDMDSRVLYYNRTHLAESGAAYPTGPWSWEDFIALARKVKKQEGDVVERWPFMSDFNLDGIYHWFPTNSSDWFSADRTRVTMTAPETVETLQFIQDLMFSYKVAGDRPARQALKMNAQNAFRAERIGMYVGSTTTPDAAQYPDLDWGVADLPQNAQPGTRLWTNLWVMPAGVKDVEAAWRLLSFFAGREGQKIVAELKAGTPAFRSVATSMPFEPRSRECILRAFNISTPYPVIAQREVWNIVTKEFQNLWNNKQPARVIAESIQQQVAPIMNK